MELNGIFEGGEYSQRVLAAFARLHKALKCATTLQIFAFSRLRVLATAPVSKLLRRAFAVALKKTPREYSRVARCVFCLLLFMSGTLFVCATPIGNLDDVSLRLLSTLREADCILAEDTRHSRLLLSRHEIEKPLMSCHGHTHPEKIASLAARLAEGETFALITDAGTPGVSDPGPPLVLAAAALGVEVIPIPGPCALVAALSISGFDAQRFSFLGFLPRKPGKRRRTLEEALARGDTVVLYESPHRVLAVIKDIAGMAPQRALCVCRELTKKFEETVRGQAAEVVAELEKRKELRGEFVVVISAPPKKARGGTVESETEDDDEQG